MQYASSFVYKKMKTSKELQKEAERVRKADSLIDWIVRIFLILIIVFVCFTLYDTFAPRDKAVDFHDFDQLAKINPDICGWLKVDDTHIDYPVVQGKDNFEYLDKNFYGDFYEGGTLFLDYRNKKDFSDEYSIIYGHNMVGGKMFGDIPKFYKKVYFDRHKAGYLFTPKKDYRLKIIGIVKADAYDMTLYSPGKIGFDVTAEISKCVQKRNAKLKAGDKLLALSTCSGSLNDDRDVLLCRMRYDPKGVDSTENK